MLQVASNSNNIALKHKQPANNILSGYLIKDGNVLFNDALNTFYLQLYGENIW